MSSGQPWHGSSPSASCALSSLGWDSGLQVSPPVCYPHLDIGSFSTNKRRNIICLLGSRLGRCCFSVLHVCWIHSGGRYLCHTDEHGHAGSIDASRSDHRYGTRYSGCNDCVVIRRGTLTWRSCASLHHDRSMAGVGREAHRLQPSTKLAGCCPPQKKWSLAGERHVLGGKHTGCRIDR